MTDKPNISRVLEILEKKQNWDQPYDVIDEGLFNIFKKRRITQAFDDKGDAHIAHGEVDWDVAHAAYKRRDKATADKYGKSSDAHMRLAQSYEKRKSQLGQGRFMNVKEAEFNEDGTSRGKGVAPRNFGAMKNVDLVRMAKDALKKKYKTREAAIAALHTLPISQQNALDKDKYRPPLRIIGEDSLNEGGPTRKHFQMAADTIRALPENKRREHAEIHAALFAKQNPRFNRAKFMEACGVKEGQITKAREAVAKSAEAVSKSARKLKNQIDAPSHGERGDKQKLDEDTIKKLKYLLRKGKRYLDKTDG